jgi:hypothetical protein
METIKLGIELSELEEDIIKFMDEIIKEKKQKEFLSNNMVYQAMEKDDENEKFLQLFKRNINQILLILERNDVIIDCPSCKRVMNEVGHTHLHYGKMTK